MVLILIHMHRSKYVYFIMDRKGNTINLYLNVTLIYKLVNIFDPSSIWNDSLLTRLFVFTSKRIPEPVNKMRFLLITQNERLINHRTEHPIAYTRQANSFIFLWCVRGFHSFSSHSDKVITSR